MHIKKYILILLTAFFFSILFVSCKGNKWHNYLVNGAWVIDSINYKGYNIKKCLTVNGMAFNENNSLFLPSAQYVCSKFYEPVETGTFKIQEINSDSAVVEFHTNNNIFAGRHLVIKQDAVKHIIVIKSDSLYMLLGQGGYQ